MCIIGFWIVELILSLPFIGEYDECCSIKVWMGFYTFITIVIRHAPKPKLVLKFWF
jgi:hypothetical protein